MELLGNRRADGARETKDEALHISERLWQACARTQVYEKKRLQSLVIGRCHQ
ncbi:MAG: hypothetical protein KAX24_01395 [Anaerolineae bacterium]|nr:hypothetical protein [Anaerolineae bacterium]